MTLWITYHGFFPEFTVHPSHFVLVHLVEFGVNLFLSIDYVLLQNLLRDGIYTIRVREDDLLRVSVYKVLAAGVVFDVATNNKASQHLILPQVIGERTNIN